MSSPKRISPKGRKCALPKKSSPHHTLVSKSRQDLGWIPEFDERDAIEGSSPPVPYKLPSSLPARSRKRKPPSSPLSQAPPSLAPSSPLSSLLPSPEGVPAGQASPLPSPCRLCGFALGDRVQMLDATRAPNRTPPLVAGTVESWHRTSPTSVSCHIVRWDEMGIGTALPHSRVLALDPAAVASIVVHTAPAAPSSEVRIRELHLKEHAIP